MPTTVSSSLELAVGLYTGSWIFTAPGSALKGKGRYETILRLSGSATAIQGSSSPYTFAPNCTVKDCTIDGSAGIAISIGSMLPGLTMENVRFVSCSYGAILNAARNVTMRNCEFVRPGDYSGVAVHMSNGSRGLDIDGLNALWPDAVLIVDGGAAGEVKCADVRMRRISANQRYWTTAVVAAGTGSYSNESLIDMSANFSASFSFSVLGKGSRAVRALVPISSGTITARATASIDCQTSIVGQCMYGDIVKSGQKWSMVYAVNGSTAFIDAWRDQTFDVVEPPDAGSEYALYKAVLGRIISQTTTRLGVERWYRLDGATHGAPTSGTLYEVMAPHNTGGVLIERGVQNVRIVDSDFEGSSSDLFTSYSDGTVIDSCRFSYGRDTAVSLNANRTRVLGCRIEGQGAQGVFVSGSDGIISSCEIMNIGHEYSYVSGTNGSPYGNAICLWDGDRALICDTYIASNRYGSFALRLHESKVTLDNVVSVGHFIAGAIRIDEQPVGDPERSSYTVVGGSIA